MLGQPRPQQDKASLTVNRLGSYTTSQARLARRPATRRIAEYWRLPAVACLCPRRAQISQFGGSRPCLVSAVRPCLGWLLSFRVLADRKHSGC